MQRLTYTMQQENAKKENAPLHDFLSDLQRPVIVTCSDETQISLSAQVDLLRLEMQHSEAQVLLEHLILVSVCEKVGTNPAWLADLLRLCRNDLR